MGEEIMEKTSQQLRILREFLKGRELTFNSARDISGSNYPIKRISELKEDGYPIQDTWVEKTDKPRYKKYWIEKEDIKSIKEE